MNLIEIQSTLAMLYTSRSVREAFFVDRTRVLEELGVSEDSREFFNALDQDNVQEFSRSIVHRRYEELLRGLPLTRHVLGAALRGYFQAFYDKNISINPIDLPTLFLESLLKTLKGSRVIDPFHYELLRYEFARLKAQRQLITFRIFHAPIRQLLSTSTKQSATGLLRSKTFGLWIRRKSGEIKECLM